MSHEVIVIGEHCPGFHAPTIAECQDEQSFLKRIASLWCGKMMMLVQAAGCEKEDASVSKPVWRSVRPVLGALEGSLVVG